MKVHTLIVFSNSNFNCWTDQANKLGCNSTLENVVSNNIDDDERVVLCPENIR